MVTSSSFEEPIFRYGERFVDEDLEEIMKSADLDRLVRCKGRSQKQARKPRSYASPKLCPASDLLIYSQE